ncbi:MAG: class I SAM-dependent methyltransferase [Burkholderiaceae bacterium]
MHERIIKGDRPPPSFDGFDSVPGRYLLAWEKNRFDALVGDVFGYYAVQLGLPGLDTLRANRMPTRILATIGRAVPADPAGETDAAARDPGCAEVAADAPADVPADPPEPQPEPGFTHRVVVERFEHLPFAEQSVDLVVMPHVLEFASDPHQVLREVDRVLRPEGRVLLSGINPISLWGARHLVPRIGRPVLPPGARLIGLPRLRDWFKLLSFDVDQHHYGCYRPPCQSQAWLDRLNVVERAGDRWWPICGAVYCVAAVKRIQAIRLIAPVWRRKEPVRRRVAVAASSTRQRQTVD